MAIAAAATALPGVALADATPVEAIAALNAERAANGIPAGIVENADWSRGCAQHNAYRRANGIATTSHDEDPGRPGYTPEGDEAGNSSVLAASDSWSTGNPFATAPIHLMQLLAPRIAQMGVDDAGGLVCMSTFRGYGPGAPVDTIYTAPGDGRVDVPAEETAREKPFVPGELLSPPTGPTTGPHILVLADGPFAAEGSMRIASATLSGPSGPVAVRTIDQTEPRIAGYIPPGGIAIPSAPLVGGTLYTASVTLEGAGGALLGRTWSFRTSGPVVTTDIAPAQTTPLATGRATIVVAVRGRRIVVRGPRVLRGRTVRIAVTHRGVTRRRAVVLRPGASIPLRRAEAQSPRTRIVVRVAGFVAKGVRWRVAPVATTVMRARR